jgi:hypothetical protein
VEQHWVASKFSTLGGNNDGRDARSATREFILVLRPRKERSASRPGRHAPARRKVTLVT